MASRLERLHGPLAGEVAIVTGASSGIGAATACELARRGATVVLAARRPDRLAEQLRSIRQTGGRAIAVPTDMADGTDVALLVERATEAYGRVDVLVNNAGAFWSTALASSPPDQIAALAQVNLLGAMLADPRGAAGDAGTAATGRSSSVGSLSGRVAMEPLYSATKYGLRGFSLALRRQLAGTGVSVCLVSPGRINTEMTKARRRAHARTRAGGHRDRRTSSRSPRREVVVPRQHYAIAWLEQALPTLADLVHRQRHWSPVREEESVTWTS